MTRAANAMARTIGEHLIPALKLCAEAMDDLVTAFVRERR